MASEAAKFGEQAKSFWTKLSTPRKIALAGGTAAMVALAAALSLRGPDEQFATLYSGLAPEDAGQVLEALKAQAVGYRLQANGTTIEVPAARVHELRIMLASSGVPRGGGAGFELFDKETFGTTSFVEQMNYQRALSGELARTISSIDAVERARVHLTMKERSLYAKSDEPPSASVVIALRHGFELAPARVRGIVHLVASSIEGLVPDRVTVLDDTGNVLWDGGENHANDAQRDLETTLKRRISEITDSVVGRGHSVIAVTAELDTAKMERTEELYDKDKYALRSESTMSERDPLLAKTVGGIAGSRGNLPGAPQPAEAETAVQDAKTKSQSTRTFEVNRVVNRVTGPKVSVKRLHVAILIDAGSSTSTTSRYGAPRSSDIERIAALAREAAGLDMERGDRLEVHSIPFAIDMKEETPAAVIAPPILSQIIAEKPLLVAGAAFALLLLFGGGGAVVLLRRRKREEREEDVMPALPLTAGEIEMVIEGGEAKPAVEAIPEKATPRELAIEAVRSDPERAARILSAWLSERPKQLEAGGQR